MKLYNASKWPDALLRRLLRRTGERVGARTGRVVVKVRSVTARLGVQRPPHGMAKSCHWSWIYPRDRGRRKGKPCVATDGGEIILWLSVPGMSDDRALWLASECVLTCLHEWGHIVDYQNPEPDKPWSRPNASGRRPAWADQPEEQRAEDRTEEALAKTRRRDDDLELEIADFLTGRSSWCPKETLQS